MRERVKSIVLAMLFVLMIVLLYVSLTLGIESEEGLLARIFGVSTATEEVVLQPRSAAELRVLAICTPDGVRMPENSTEKLEMQNALSAVYSEAVGSAGEAQVITGRQYLDLIKSPAVYLGYDTELPMFLLRTWVGFDAGERESRLYSLLIAVREDEVVVAWYDTAAEEYRMAVTAAAAGQLPVVALALEDVAQAGADTHDVRDDRRDVVTAEVRDAFLLQGEAGAGGSGQRTRAAAGRAEEHVDAGKLGLRLDELTADLLHAPGHILQNLRLRGDGIAAEETASSAKTGLCKGLIAFHQYFSHCFVTSLSFQNFDRVVRAHSVAAAAGDALFFIDLHGFIALLAKLTGRRERLDRAHAHAQVAALTPLGVQLDFFHRWINPPA